ncbi:hypothetical protein [Parashewanella tropica]|uniref:hypothetical protein n=1 Tax=Parashewanella tropica TaxID=2547970 RepID=UPI00105A21DD|nr:hypothetical protein [Parashewanella tropica]
MITRLEHYCLAELFPCENEENDKISCCEDAAVEIVLDKNDLTDDEVDSKLLHDEVVQGCRCKLRITDSLGTQDHRLYQLPQSNYSFDRSVDLLMYSLGIGGCFVGGIVGGGVYLAGVCLSSSLITSTVCSSIFGLCGASFGGLAGTILGHQTVDRNIEFQRNYL